jgi:hypothetical protein
LVREQRHGLFASAWRRTSPRPLSCAWYGVHAKACQLLVKRGEVETQPTLRAAESHRAELACVLVDPAALDAEHAREVGCVNESGRRLLAQPLRDAVGDRIGELFDVVGVELHRSSSGPWPAVGVVYRVNRRDPEGWRSSPRPGNSGDHTGCSFATYHCAARV